MSELRSRLASRGMRQADLANLLGINPTAVSKALGGKRQFTHPEMVKIEAALGGPEAKPGRSVKSLPIIGQVAAGQWQDAVQQPRGHMPVSHDNVPKRAFALEVDGDSMDLKVPNGGTIVVDPDDKGLYPGRFFVVLNEHGETTFKQFEADPARLVPCSSNVEHKEIVLGDGTAFTIVGRVIGAYSVF